MKFIHDFLDRKYTLTEGILMMIGIFGFVAVFEMVTRINIRLYIGIIFLSVGIYGIIRAFVKERKKKNA